jgi:hypothetical protein
MMNHDIQHIIKLCFNNLLHKEHVSQVEKGIDSGTESKPALFVRLFCKEM